MIINIIMILLIISPICNGITYLFVSKHSNHPYDYFAKFKNVNDNYEYKNKQAGIIYIGLGLIIGLFFILLCILYNFFLNISIFLRIFGLYFIIYLLETIIFDTILNIKFQLENGDKK